MNRGICFAALVVITSLVFACRDPSPPPICAESISLTLACGANRRGTESRTCVDGAWQVDECVDSDVCRDGTWDLLACGLNGRGAAPRLCADGAWDPPDPCVDPDVCIDGDEGDPRCGLNFRGTWEHLCVAGVWSFSPCRDPDACLDGSAEHQPCGLLGARTRSCELGQWSAFGDCVAPLVISAPTRRDVVHDAKRGRLYISTFGHSGDGQVLSYDLEARRFDPPLLSGGAFLGIDLSSDEDQLVVADASSDAAHVWIHRVELPTGAVHKHLFPRGFAVEGTFAVAFGTDHEVVITSGGGTSLRTLNLQTGAVRSPFRGVSSKTMLATSANGSTLALAERNSPGHWGIFDVPTQTLTSTQLDHSLYELALDRTGDQLALPTYGGLHLLSRDGATLRVLGTPGRALPVGVVYSPVRDELYLAWAGATTSIDVIDTKTFRRLRELAPIPGMFFWAGGSAGPASNTPFHNGRLRISRDGTLLFATTPPAGVAIYETGSSPPTGSSPRR
jgi:hypothetical protein